MAWLGFAKPDIKTHASRAEKGLAAIPIQHLEIIPSMKHTLTLLTTLQLAPLVALLAAEPASRL